MVPVPSTTAPAAFAVTGAVIEPPAATPKMPAAFTVTADVSEPPEPTWSFPPLTVVGPV